MALEVVGSNPIIHPTFSPPTFAVSGDFFVKFNIGVSSSGKTQHFDCCIRRFESCHPSQEKQIRTIRFCMMEYLDLFFILAIFSQKWIVDLDYPFFIDLFIFCRFSLARLSTFQSILDPLYFHRKKRCLVTYNEPKNLQRIQEFLLNNRLVSFYL